VMWRSLPDMSSIFFNRSLSVTFMVVPLFFPNDSWAFGFWPLAFGL
jgi:hypothetical protein